MTAVGAAGSGTGATGGAATGSGAETPTEPATAQGAEPAAERAATPLLEPRDGLPDPVAEPEPLAAAVARLAAGTGPVAIDAERASGYRYSQRAYLVQLRRAGAGTILIDPVPFGDLIPLHEAIGDAEWVLHAASQDLPCLAELGLRPGRLFDTELAARLLGYPKVGLGAIVEEVLGFRLEKGHSAADWSTRPLPAPWLVYAALDVELLLELKAALAEQLAADGKLEWALQEFAAVATTTMPAPRPEPWRRTSGMHKIRNRRQMAVVRALWESRDQLAQRRDIAPGRVLPDSAIVAAALANPKSPEELQALPVYGGRHHRKLAARWFGAIQGAVRLPDAALPQHPSVPDGPPPVNRWSDRDPAAAARLAAARGALTAMAEQLRLPVENLLTPDLVRRLTWAPPEDRGRDGVAERLRHYGARPWQIELTATALSEALAAG